MASRRLVSPRPFPATSRATEHDARWLAKLGMVASLTLFTFVVTMDNIIDFDANFAFVRHVLSMDTTFPDDTLRWRAITEPTLWHVFYALIILGEGLTCLVFALAALQMARALRSSPPIFNAAKPRTYWRADRFHRVVHWVHGDWRRMVWDVAIADLERPTSSISFLRNATRSIIYVGQPKPEIG